MSNKKDSADQKTVHDAYIQSLAYLCLADGLTAMDSDKDRVEKKRGLLGIVWVNVHDNQMGDAGIARLEG